MLGIVAVAPACKPVAPCCGVRYTWVEATWGPLPSGCELRKDVTFQRLVPVMLPPVDDEVKVRSKTTLFPLLRSFKGVAAEVTLMAVFVIRTPRRTNYGLIKETKFCSLHI